MPGMTDIEEKEVFKGSSSIRKNSNQMAPRKGEKDLREKEVLKNLLKALFLEDPEKEKEELHQKKKDGVGETNNFLNATFICFAKKPNYRTKEIRASFPAKEA